MVFEPNTEPTWTPIRTSITNFLRTVWRNGALMGTTQDEAFFVKCDRTTMTQDDIDNGRLICHIGIAPVKPAEFVIFRICQKTARGRSRKEETPWPPPAARNDPLRVVQLHRRRSRTCAPGSPRRRPRDRDRHHRVPRGQRGHHRAQAPGQAQVHQHHPQARLHPTARSCGTWRKTRDRRQDAAQAGTITLLDEARKPALTLELPRGLAVEVGGPGAQRQEQRGRDRGARDLRRGARRSRRSAGMPMPTRYRTPGRLRRVARRRSPSGSIVGRTDVAGFVGIAERGPAARRRSRSRADRSSSRRSASHIAATATWPTPSRLLRQRRPHLLGGARGRSGGGAPAPRPAASMPDAGAGRRSKRRSPGALGQRHRASRPCWGRDRCRRSSCATPDGRAQLIDLDLDRSPTPPRRRRDVLTEPARRPRRCDAAGAAAERHRPAGRAPTASPRPSRDARTRSAAASRLCAAAPTASATLDASTTSPAIRIATARRGASTALERIDGVSFVAVPDLHGRSGSDSLPRRRRLPPASASDRRSATRQIALINSCHAPRRPRCAHPRSCRRSAEPTPRSRYRAATGRTTSFAARLPPVARRRRSARG